MRGMGGCRWGVRTDRILQAWERIASNVQDPASAAQGRLSMGGYDDAPSAP